MNGEIDRDFYCGAGVVMTDCCAYQSHACTFECECCHRKWPTPEQYKKEYSEEYPEGGAIYWLSPTIEKWYAVEYRGGAYEPLIVCACTPWGKPPDDWRPQQ
jgi:hypothetical protein